MKEFYYLYSKPEDKKQRISLVGYINKKENLLQIGLSECSISDQYNRKLGRKIAEGRSKKKPYIKISLDSEVTERKVLDILYKELNNFKDININNL